VKDDLSEVGGDAAIRGQRVPGSLKMPRPWKRWLARRISRRIDRFVYPHTTG
jgi:hypothetical protein